MGGNGFALRTAVPFYSAQTKTSLRTNRPCASTAARRVSLLALGSQIQYISRFAHKKTTLARGFQMARPEGLEPSTYRLTAGRSTIELRANKSF